MTATVGLLAALLAPSLHATQPPARLDLLEHAAGFAVVTLAWRLAVGRDVRVLVGLLVLAVVTEVLQGAVVGGRQGDPLDALADALGVAVVWLPRVLPGDRAPNRHPSST